MFSFWVYYGGYYSVVLAGAVPMPNVFIGGNFVVMLELLRLCWSFSYALPPNSPEMLATSQISELQFFRWFHKHFVCEIEK